MKKFFRNFINDKDKELKWYNTNYFYAFTLCFAITLLVCFFAAEKAIDSVSLENNFWNVYVMSFCHADVVHVTFNTIMFVLLSLLLERHFGSFTYFIMFLFIIPIANITNFATDGLLYGYSSWTGCGESCVNCFLLGLYLVVAAVYSKQYVLSFRAFLTFIPLGFIMFFFSVDSNAISTPQEFFQHPKMQFMHAFSSNMSGHLAPFIMGLVVVLLIYTVLLTNKFVLRKFKEKK